MTEHTYPEYLWLRKGEAPPPDPHEAAVRVYADTDGALRSIQSDGTDAAIGGGGASPYLSATVTLTDAEVAALPTSAVTIIPAPAGNEIIVGLQAIAHLKNWQADYGNINASAQICFGRGGDISPAAIGAILAEAPNGFVTSLLAGGGPDGTWAFFPAAANSLRIPSVPAAPQIGGMAGWYDSDLAGLSLALFANNQGDGNFTGGDPAQSMDVTVIYNVFPTA